jgi:hypothetical protein
MADRPPVTRKRKRRAADVEAARARWSLVFYCWRNLLLLLAATAATVDTILAITEGRPSYALNELIALLRQL